MCKKLNCISCSIYILWNMFQNRFGKKICFPKISETVKHCVFLYLLKSVLGLQAVVFQWDEKSTMSTSAFLLPFSSAPQSMNKKNLFCFFCFMTKKIYSFGSLSSSQEYHFHQHQAADLEEKN